MNLETSIPRLVSNCARATKTLALAVVATCSITRSSSAAAEQEVWTYVGQGRAGYQAFVNDNRTLRIGDVAEAWVKFIWFEPNSDGTKWSTMLHRFDCGRWGDTLLSYIDYGPGGTVVDTRTYLPAEQESVPVAPDTTMDLVINYACSLPPKK